MNHRDISQFQKTFTEIEEYQQRSGCHWDNDLGAEIEGEDASSIFKDYVKVCSLYSSPLFMTNWPSRPIPICAISITRVGSIIISYKPLFQPILLVGQMRLPQVHLVSVLLNWMWVHC